MISRDRAIGKQERLRATLIVGVVPVASIASRPSGPYLRSSMVPPKSNSLLRPLPSAATVYTARA